MANNKTREDVWGSCGSKSYQFLFDWAYANRQLLPSDAFIRVYIVSKDDFFANGSIVVPVRVSLNLQVTNNSNGTTSEADDTPQWTSLGNIDVNINSSSWHQFNIKESLVHLWDPEAETFVIVVTLKFDVGCEQSDELPMTLLNPAVFNLTEVRRQEIGIFQPILVIYTDDKLIKKVIRNSYLVSHDERVTLQDRNERRKRYAPDHICHIEDFTLRFSDLGINYVNRPVSLNIKRCVGDCSIYQAPYTAALTTNHARLMTSAASSHRNQVFPPNSLRPENPCCSPIGYHPEYIMTTTPDKNRYKISLEQDMIVSRCGCR
jgi:hypothetical protein